MIRHWFSSYAARHALSISLAVMTAIMLTHYFFSPTDQWMVLTAFLVCQTTRGTVLRQSVSYYFTIVLAILLESLLMKFLQPSLLIYASLGTLFIVSSYAALISRPVLGKSFYPTLLFSIILLIAVLSPATTSMMDSSIEALIGGLIGILFSQLILPVRPYKEFSQGIVPVLNAFKAYSLAFEQASHALFVEKSQHIENSLQEQSSLYPEWVYETGFNPGLRSGFRFFLINVERISELYISMNYYLTQVLLPSSPEHARMPELTQTMQKNAELLTTLIDYFTTGQITSSDADFTTDIKELEAAVQHEIPQSLELLDLSPLYLTLAVLVRDVKDIREILLQLVLALPKPLVI